MAATESTCKCGKLMCFPTGTIANEFLETEKAKRLKLIRAYECLTVPNVWHVTRRIKSGRDKLKHLEEELHREVATIRENIISYMEFWYEKNKKYKFYTREVSDAVRKKSPTTLHTVVAQEISKMKKLGLIVGLDESVPSSKGVKYFALAKHLDEVTKPNDSRGGEKTVAVEAKKTSEVKLPSQVATNPFDKVNSQLGEILSKLNGLATGYAQLVDHAQAQRSAVENSESNTARVIDMLRELKLITSSHVTVDGDKLADVINARLQNLKLEDSFVYSVRNELEIQTGKFEELTLTFQEYLDRAKPPTNFGTLSDEEKYRLGVRDGIKLAAEMGIILPDA